VLRVALPNKGQLAEPARSMLSEAGYLHAAAARDLVVQDPDNDAEFFFLRP
jgi:ATP phosphoribosyltransferase